jgi:DNA-binding transcriptional LysR family regulator
VSNTLLAAQRFAFGMKLTLRLIEQVMALAQSGNFARAAEQLGISQPTLSRNIAALEKDLGLVLFDRGRSGASPTVFGQLVLVRGRRVLNEAGALHEELMAVAGMDAGQLKIVAGPYAVEDPIAEAVARLSKERPALRIRINQVGPDEVSAAVLSREHELGFGGFASQFPHEHLRVEPLKQRRLFLACRPGHPLLAGPPSIEQVLSFPMVTVLLHGAAGEVAATGVRAGSMDAGRRGFSPAIEVNSFDAARRIVRQTDALFPATASMLAADLAAGHVATVDFDTPTLRSTPAIVRLSERTLSPAAERFLAIVMLIEAEQPDLPAA